MQGDQCLPSTDPPWILAGNRFTAHLVSYFMELRKVSRKKEKNRQMLKNCEEEKEEHLEGEWKKNEVNDYRMKIVNEDSILEKNLNEIMN
ncbi:Translation Initiation Factor If-2 [Manis pentadactyla]|nr:Translation Initiation Factor If-2 [Manis pentadactyla]